MAMTFTEERIKELRFGLEDSVIKCSERCLYQSAKWYLPAFLDHELGQD